MLNRVRLRRFQVPKRRIIKDYDAGINVSREMGSNSAHLKTRMVVPPPPQAASGAI